MLAFINNKTIAMQTNLFKESEDNTPQFKGSDYNEQLDKPRLKTQFDKVFELMKDGMPRTLNEIEISTGILAQASISAHLRYMRKLGHVVIKSRRGDKKQGLFEYKLITKNNHDNN
jgi:predicted transcriptional regulator